MRASLPKKPEMHRVYQPWLSAHESSSNVASRVDSIAKSDLLEQGNQARSSRDKALTVYAQPVALYLNSVSIPSSRTVEDDELWLGSAVLSKPDAICEHCMIKTCTTVDDCSATLTAKGPAITDCCLDNRFKDRLYVQSKPGIRFYASVSEPADSDALESASGETNDLARTSLHALLDDNKTDRQLLVMFMKKHQFSYAEAEDGQEALDANRSSFLPGPHSDAPSRRFDVVLLGTLCSVLNGMNSTRRIRGFEKENMMTKSNVIALTGLASAQAQQEAEDSGIDIFLPKPDKFAELKKLLFVKSQD